MKNSFYITTTLPYVNADLHMGHALEFVRADIIARYKKDYAIGITLNEEDLENPELKNKIHFLATRQTKSSNKDVLLFVGIPNDLKKKIEFIISTLDENVRKNIKIQFFNHPLSSDTKSKKKKTFLN